MRFAIFGVWALVSQSVWSADRGSDLVQYFFSTLGREHKVRFSAVFQVPKERLKEIQAFNGAAKAKFIEAEVKPTTAYMFGPLSFRYIGSPQKSPRITVDWAKVRVDQKYLNIPYVFEGSWIIKQDVAALRTIVIPIPFNKRRLLTPKWKMCSDQDDPQHQQEHLLWYFWEPKQQGCDHLLGQHFQEVRVELMEETVQQKQTYPEYSRLIRVDPVTSEKSISMTFAFGYDDTPEKPDPETDNDVGALEYRKFKSYVLSMIAAYKPTLQPILQKEYLAAKSPNAAMGTRVVFVKNEIKYIVNLVMATEFGQVELFHQSFLKDHESFFSWFGHSRIGDGFNESLISAAIKKHPEVYSVSNEYQIIFWAGCNTYAYYTVPFFRLKASDRDPMGTKNLDIISTGLKSLFRENANSALTIFRAILSGDEKPQTYQTIIYNLEYPFLFINQSQVLYNVLGDEDNGALAQPAPRR